MSQGQQRIFFDWLVHLTSKFRLQNRTQRGQYASSSALTGGPFATLRPKYSRVHHFNTATI